MTSSFSSARSEFSSWAPPIASATLIYKEDQYLADQGTLGDFVTYYSSSGSNSSSARIVPGDWINDYIEDWTSYLVAYNSEVDDFDTDLGHFNNAYNEVEYFINLEYTDASISSQYDSDNWSDCASVTVYYNESKSSYSSFSGSSGTSTTSTCDNFKWIEYLREKPAAIDLVDDYKGYYYDDSDFSSSNTLL